MPERFRVIQGRVDRERPVPTQEQRRAITAAEQIVAMFPDLESMKDFDKKHDSRLGLASFGKGAPEVTQERLERQRTLMRSHDKLDDVLRHCVGHATNPHQFTSVVMLAAAERALELAEKQLDLSQKESGDD